MFLPNTKAFGTVRFIGETHFAAETWVGIELDLPKGRNGGEIQVGQGGGTLLEGTGSLEWLEGGRAHPRLSAMPPSQPGPE